MVTTVTVVKVATELRLYSDSVDSGASADDDSDGDDRARGLRP